MREHERDALTARNALSLDDYQRDAMRTSNGCGDEKDLAIAALGLAGEAGEVADLLKKFLGHGHALETSKLAGELGDCLWYIARIAEHFDLSLSDVAVQNIVKLNRRYPNGFSHEASKNRTE